MTEIIDDINLDKLELLKAKMKGNMPPEIVKAKTRSLDFGIVGTGQAGSRLAECFHKLGYGAIVMNTALQDLEHINVPKENKLHLEYGLGGAAKEMEIGKEAASVHSDAIHALIAQKLPSCEVFVLCVSLGGGSGAGSAEVVLNILNSIGKPVVCICVLPMENDDAQTKHNSLETLANLGKLASAKKIQSLICVDNAKIEAIFSDVSQLDFFRVANEAIVEPIDAFNKLSMLSSPSKALDSTEWAKLLLDGEGFSIFASLTISEFKAEESIAEAIISNLDNNLLAGGFDLKQTKYAGFIIAGNKKVMDSIPSSAIGYAAAVLQEHCGTPKATFRGIYVTNDLEDELHLYTCFSGLGMPNSRVESLKKDARELMSKAKGKDEGRNLTLQLDTGTNDTVSAAQKVKEKIASKSSAFSKFLTGVIKK